MTRPVVPPHRCNQDYFAVCSCGRPGHGTFSLNARQKTAIGIERTFEYVEATADDQTFTSRQVRAATNADSAIWRRDVPTAGTIEKTLRLMEHLGYVEKVDPGGPWHPDVWRRAAPVGGKS